MAPHLTQYDHADIRHLIDGYMIRRQPNESPEQYFERGKAELVVNLDRRLAQVKSYTFADFSRPRR